HADRRCGIGEAGLRRRGRARRVRRRHLGAPRAAGGRPPHDRATARRARRRGPRRRGTSPGERHRPDLPGGRPVSGATVVSGGGRMSVLHGANRLLRLTVWAVWRQFLDWSGAWWFALTLAGWQLIGPLI